MKKRLTIDPERSTVTIEASSTLHPIRETASGLEGWVDVDGERVVGGEVSFAVKNLRSGNPIQDRELRRRINARRHPHITGRLTEPDDPTAGEITFRGVTQQVYGHLRLEPGGSIRILGSTKVDIRGWKLEPPKILALRVDPEVVVSIDVHAVEA